MILVGMVVLVWVGAGLGMYHMADLYHRLGLGRWTMLVALANPGLVTASGLLLSDVLAWGLAMAGLASFVRRDTVLAILSFSLAALTRETMLLIPLGIALYLLTQRKYWTAFALAFLSAAPFTPIAFGLP